jgi:hypothetical protein
MKSQRGVNNPRDADVLLKLYPSHLQDHRKRLLFQRFRVNETAIRKTPDSKDRTHLHL